MPAVLHKKSLVLIIIETAGVIAFIFSLIYLARQVRDNTRISSTTTRQSIQDSLTNLTISFWGDSDFRKIFNKHLFNEELNSEQLLYLESFS